MFDSNKNSIIGISENQYKYLEKYLLNNDDSYMKSEEIDKLYRQGFLSTNRVKEIIHDDDELLSYSLENDVELLILQVTQQCNFRCGYCVYSGNYNNRNHTSKRMNLSTAYKGIDFLINHSKNRRQVVINFYGGEPLLEFDLIKRCINYAKEKGEGKKIKFNMTTNGYLLNDEIIEFLIKNDVSIMISLDGPKEVHDEHRKLALNGEGTFDKVMSKIQGIRKKYPNFIKNLSFSTVMDPNNDFCKIDNFFKSNSSVKDISITPTLINENQSKIPLSFSEDFFLDMEYERFRDLFYVLKNKSNENNNNSRLTRNDIYDNMILLSEQLYCTENLPNKTHPGGPCVPGVHRLFMNVDGSLFPCERCNESSNCMKIGHVESGFDIDKARALLNIGKITEEKCKNCWAISHCNICAAKLVEESNEFSKEAKIKLCEQVEYNVLEKFKNYCLLKEFNHNISNNYEDNYLIRAEGW